MNSKNTTLMAVIGVIALVLIGLVVFNRRAQVSNTAVQTSQTADNDEDDMLPASPEAMMASDSATQATTASTSATTGNVKQFTVTGSSFKFAPAQLTVNRGDTVEIVFKNSGGIHNFVIDEFKVATKEIQGGAQETVRFVADKPGIYEFYCSVGNHRQMGMKGTLVVQ